MRCVGRRLLRFGERDDGRDGCPVTRRGHQCELSTHASSALLHARQTDPFSRRRLAHHERVKSAALVADVDANVPALPRETDRGVGDAGVLADIARRLPGNTEQREFHRPREALAPSRAREGDIPAIGMQVLCLLSQRGGQTEVIQHRRS